MLVRIVAEIQPEVSRLESLDCLLFLLLKKSLFGSIFILSKVDKSAWIDPLCWIYIIIIIKFLECLTAPFSAA
jgi:hypothetical protein